MEDFKSIYPERSFKLSPQMKIRYVKHGTGYPIIFLHGLGADHHQWKETMPAVEDDFAVYALDFPGHGKSSWPKDYPYSIENHARAVLELMDVENLDKAVFVGSSMGGHVALYLAVNHPDRVNRLVLADPAGGAPFEFFDKYSSLFMALNPPLELMGERYIRWRRSLVVERNKNHPIFENYTRKKLLVFRDPKKLDRYKEILTTLVFDIMTSNLPQHVHKIDQPTLIVWGANDQLIDLSYGLELHKTVKSSFMDIYPETGHVPPIERPRWFNKKLNFFLRDLTNDSMKQRAMR